MSDERSPRGSGGRKQGSAEFRSLPEGQIPAKEFRLLENRFVHGLTLADSALRAGYEAKDRKAATETAGRIIRRHTRANSEFMKSLDRAGVNIETLARVIAEGLEAETVRQGVATPDFHSRHKFVECCLNIFGVRASRKIEVETGPSFEQRLERLSALKSEDVVQRLVVLNRGGEAD